MKKRLLMLLLALCLVIGVMTVTALAADQTTANAVEYTAPGATTATKMKLTDAIAKVKENADATGFGGTIKLTSSIEWTATDSMELNAGCELDLNNKTLYLNNATTGLRLKNVPSGTETTVYLKVKNGTIRANWNNESGTSSKGWAIRLETGYLLMDRVNIYARQSAVTLDGPATAESSVIKDSYLLSKNYAAVRSSDAMSTGAVGNIVIQDSKLLTGTSSQSVFRTAGATRTVTLKGEVLMYQKSATRALADTGVTVVTDTGCTLKERALDQLFYGPQADLYTAFVLFRTTSPDGDCALYTAPDGTQTTTGFAHAINLVNCNKGGTIKLLKDSTNSMRLVVNYGCVIDLNGKTLANEKSPLLEAFPNYQASTTVLSSENGHASDSAKIVRIIDGTIIADGAHRNSAITTNNYGIRLWNGYLQMENVDMCGDQVCIDVYGVMAETDTCKNYLKNCNFMALGWHTFNIRTNATTAATNGGYTIHFAVEDCTFATLSKAASSNAIYAAAKNVVKITATGSVNCYSTGTAISGNVGYTDESAAFLPAVSGDTYTCQFCTTGSHTLNRVSSGAVSYITAAGKKTAYATLADAVSACNTAKDGGTIRLYDDVEVTATAKLTASCTLDLNGYTLTGAKGVMPLQVSNKTATVKILDGTIQVTGTDATSKVGGGWATIRFAGAYLQMENVTILGDDAGVDINYLAPTDTETGETSYIKNCRIESTWRPLYVRAFSDGAMRDNTNDVMNLTVEDCVILSTGEAALGQAIYYNYKYNDTNMAPDNTKLQLTLKGNNKLYSSYEAAIGWSGASKGCVIEYTADSGLLPAVAKVTLTECPICDAGHTLLENMYFTEPQAAYSDGTNVIYTTLTDAVKRVNENKGGTIGLLKDVKTTQIKVEYGCVLDLDGHVLTCAANPAIQAFGNNAARIGTVLSDETGHATDASKTLRILDGTIVAEGKTRDGETHATNQNYGVRLFNGYLQMEGVTVESDFTAIDIYGLADETATAKSYMEDCVLLSHGYHTVHFRVDMRTYTANKGEENEKVYNANRIASMRFTDTEIISLGKYKDANECAIYAGTRVTALTVEEGCSAYSVNSGYAVSANVQYSEDSHYRFSEEKKVTIESCPICDGTHENMYLATPVSEASYKAPGADTAINYGTLAAAVSKANANGGGTITLLKNVTAGDNGKIGNSKTAIPLTTGATVDLGGHTLTATEFTAIGINAPGQTVIVTNGNIVQNREGFSIRLVEGYLDMSKVSAYSQGSANVAIYSSDNEQENTITDCTLISDRWCGVVYRLEAADGVQTGLNTIMTGCTVASAKTTLFEAMQAGNKLTITGENHFYVPAMEHYISDANTAPSCQVVLTAAMDLVGENESVSFAVAGVDHEFQHMKYYKTTPLADGIDLTQPEAFYGADLATLQKAIVETAYAYFNKGNPSDETGNDNDPKDYVRYSADRLTSYSDVSSRIMSLTNLAPEDLAADNTFYTICGQYIYSVYANAIDGFELLGGARNAYITAMLSAQSKDSPLIVDKWSADGLAEENVDDSRKAWVQKWYDNFNQLQPGDIILLMQKGGTYSSGLAGHGMLYVGNNTILHNGDKIINDVRNNLFNVEKAGTGTWNLYWPNNTVEDGGTVLGEVLELAIMRPLNDPFILNAYASSSVKGVLSSAAEARIETEGLEVTLSANGIGEYATLEAGKEYTLNLEITNNSGSAWDAEYALNMNNTEKVVAGTVNVSGTETVSYTFTVPADAKLGDTYVITGNVNGLHTRTMTFTVGGAKIDVEVEEAGTLTNSGTAGAFVNQFYKEKFGVELNLPDTMAALKNEIFGEAQKYYTNPTATVEENRYIEVLVPNPESSLSGIILPDHVIGGQVVLHDLAYAPVSIYADRVTKFHEASYEVGDIFIGVKANWTRSKNTETGIYSNTLQGYTEVAYIYLGNGMVAEATDTGYKLQNFKDVVDVLNKQAGRMSDTGGMHDAQWLVVLRPSLTAAGGAIGDDQYASAAVAIEKAKSGETVTIKSNTSIESLILNEGVTLDLGGKTLSVGDIETTGAIIKDTTQKGLLKVTGMINDEPYAIFATNNPQLPLWDAEAGGYRLAEIKFRTQVPAADPQSDPTFYFRYDLTNTAWKELLKGTAEAYIRVDGVDVTKIDPDYLTALYNSEPNKGALKVTFVNAPASADVQIVVVANGVELVSAVSVVTNAQAEA